MLKRHPRRDGAVQLGGEQTFPNRTRTILQANERMAARHAWLMRLFPYFREARHG